MSFGEAKYLDPSRGANLETGGVVTASYGQDPKELLLAVVVKLARGAGARIE